MGRKSTEPLKKITVDLFLTDVVWLQANSENLSEEIRGAVHSRVLRRKDANRILLEDHPNAR